MTHVLKTTNTELAFVFLLLTVFKYSQRNLSDNFYVWIVFLSIYESFLGARSYFFLKQIFIVLINEIEFWNIMIYILYFSVSYDLDISRIPIDYLPQFHKFILHKLLY